MRLKTLAFVLFSLFVPQAQAGWVAFPKIVVAADEGVHHGPQVQGYQAGRSKLNKILEGKSLSKLVNLLIEGKNNELLNVDDLYAEKNLKLLLIYKKFSLERELAWFRWNTTQNMIDFREPARSRVNPPTKMSVRPADPVTGKPEEFIEFPGGDLISPDLPYPEDIYLAAGNRVSPSEIEALRKTGDSVGANALSNARDFRAHQLINVRLGVVNTMIMEKYGLAYLVKIETLKKQLEETDPDFDPKKEVWQGDESTHSVRLINKLTAPLELEFQRY